MGIAIDEPMMDTVPRIYSGYNIRVRAGKIETLGLYGPLRDVEGEPVMLASQDKFRSLFTTPSIATGQVLAGSASTLALIEFDPTSTIATGTRWKTYDVTPSPLATASDDITTPSAGRIEIPPVWWFDDQDDLVVGQRADVADDVPYQWGRNRNEPFRAIQPSRHPNDPEWPSSPDVGPAPDPAPTPVPFGAVGGGIINRILVLIGGSSFTAPDPERHMTIRWSDRFDYGQWTPSDVTISGEIQLEGGSRIVGGGITGFGVVAWTDCRMAILRETFDSNSVFDRQYIDGGRGLLANNSWTEADGKVYWIDEMRTLNVFDGGRPRQIVNTNKYATVERVEDGQAARIYLEPNMEFGEVIIFYPSGDSGDPQAELVYNYLHDCWYIWALSRTAWSQRVGSIPNLGVGSDGAVWRHDLDVSLANPWFPVLPSPQQRSTDADDVMPIDFAMDTNLVVMDGPSYTSWRTTKVTLDYIPAPAEGADDTFSVSVRGFREPVVSSPSVVESHPWLINEVSRDYRIGGKAVQIRVSGVSVKTVYRFGKIDINVATGGQR
ncbi:MAG: hypothetical protein GY700_06105 [Propionibacteriaceae bacterium]|nr:hypothetical protein [Propionibacteriaceae bacterium]